MSETYTIDFVFLLHFLLKFIDLFKILLRLLSYLRKLHKVHKCIKNHRIVVGTMPRNVLNFLNLELIWYWKFLSQLISFQHYLDLWIHSNFIHLYIICFCQSLSFISSCMHTYKKKNWCKHLHQWCFVFRKN